MSTDSNELGHKGQTEPATEDPDLKVPGLEDGYSRKHDPHSFSRRTKASCIGTMSFGELIIPFVSMTLAPSLPQVMQSFAPQQDPTGQSEAPFEFGGIADKGSFTVTVYMIGLAIGLLLFGSLSDVYGRLIITRPTALCYTIASIACALSPSLNALITFRAIAGFFGGAAQVIGGSVVADLYPEGQRDAAMAFYVVGPAIGPPLGSVVGSLINSALGWRWVFWFASIISGVFTLLCFLVLRETNARILLARTDLTKPAPASHQKRLHIGSLKSWAAITTPLRIIFLPSILLVILNVAVLSGWFNVLISSLGSVYQEIYHFPPRTAGFPYIAICIGSVLSLIFAKDLTKKLAGCLTKRAEEAPTTELAQNEDLHHRNYLPMLFAGTVLAAVGWTIYGWACQIHTHWIVSMVGLFLYGLSGSVIRFSATLFIIEAVPGWSGSAMSALMVVTSIFGAVIPISTFPLYVALGIGWTYTLIALTSIGFGLTIVLLYLFARRLKGKCSIKVQLGQG